MLILYNPSKKMLKLIYSVFLDGQAENNLDQNSVNVIKRKFPGFLELKYLSLFIICMTV